MASAFVKASALSRDDTHGDGAVVGCAAEQILGGAVGDDAALVDDDGAGADGFDFFQDVGGDDDRLVGGHLADELADVVLLVRIEAVGRLVHDQNLGVVQDGLGNADAALEAFRERFDALIENTAEAGLLDRGGDARAAVVACVSTNLSDEGQEARGRHVGVGRRAFGNVTRAATLQPSGW